MCGIIGIYNNNLPEIKIKKIAETLNHRGPDDEGYYFDKENKIAFAHKRLSIIDLQTGHQPISNEDETIWIIFNGEIYNYKILKNELIIKGHKFKTKSDTEVIIHCYEEYGENFVEKLNGIFAFALWDKRLKKIIVARDKVGVKPLYYYSDNNIIIFASEIKAILKHPSIKIEPDYESIDKYLTFLYIPDEKTFFKNIKKLMPGFLLLIKEGQITIKQYWDLQISKNEKENDKKFIYENFLELFEEVVKDQMMSDVPIGSFLSGGIDTSCICSLLSKNMSERLKTFTVSYSKNLSYDEYFYAKIIGEKINADMYRIEQNPYEFRESLSEIIFKLDQPSTGAALVPLYFVSKLAKENNVKVVFSGEGGDELFAGYPRYFITYLHFLLSNGSPQFCYYYPKFIKLWGWKFNFTFLKRLFNNSKYFYYDIINFFNNKKKKKLLTNDFKKKYSKSYFYIIEDYFNKVKENNFFEQLLYIDFKTYLVGLLEVLDKIAMAHSLEGRVPFLDERIIEFTYKLNLNQKIENFENKIFLKKVFKNILPEKILTASKKGFLVPTDMWLKNELYDYIREILLSNRLKDRNIFNTEYIKKLINQHKNGIKNNSTKLWVLLNIEIWFREFIDKNKL